MNDLNPPAIFLAGPTASGKTALAIELTEHFPCDIISVDSAMVYRDMDIGTAKPSAAELKKAPHQLIDCFDPAKPYSAANFCDDALDAMSKITKKGRIPLLVGGTMLYFKALYDGLAPLPKANAEIRERLLLEAKNRGWPILHQRLAQIDPEAAIRIKPTDTQRLQRALEVFELSNKTISSWHKEATAYHFPYNTKMLALMPSDRKALHSKIESRFENMLLQGFEAEVRNLYTRNDLNTSLPSMRTVGYRQMWAWFENKLTSYEEMKEKSIIATRQLARRQCTWLRHWQQQNFIDADSNQAKNIAIKQINLHLQHYPNLF